MDIPILYEDEAVVVIDKPVGVICNRAETVRVPTLQDWWESRYKVASEGDKSEDELYFLERSGLVHRLDKDERGDDYG